MKIRSAVLQAMGLPAPYAQSRPLKIQEVELDSPGPREVLVRVQAAGVGFLSSCHFRSFMLSST